MKLAILSRDKTLYSTRRLQESAIKKGLDTSVIDYLKCSMQMEEKRPAIYYNGISLNDVDAIIPRIGASRTFFGTAVVRQFEMLNTFTINSSLSINRSRDKLRSLQVLTKKSVPMPKTVFASNFSDVNDIINQVGGAPLVIKVLEGTQGIGVVLAETNKAARSVIEAFHGLQVNLLVQEFIAEANATDMRVFVVGGKVIGAMKRKGKEGEFRSNLHRGGTSENIKLTKQEKYIALDAVKALGLDVAGVDMIPSSRGPLIMEVNSSPGLEGIEAATGEDVAGQIIDFIIANTHKKRKDTIGV